MDTNEDTSLSGFTGLTATARMSDHVTNQSIFNEKQGSEFIKINIIESARNVDLRNKGNELLLKNLSLKDQTDRQPARSNLITNRIDVHTLADQPSQLRDTSINTCKIKGSSRSSSVNTKMLRASSFIDSSNNPFRR